MYNNDLVDIITDSKGSEGKKAASEDILIPVITNVPSSDFTQKTVTPASSEITSPRSRAERHEILKHLKVN